MNSVKTDRSELQLDTNGVDCKLVHLIDLKFNPVLTYGYRLVSELEPDLIQMQQDILHADHDRPIIAS